MGRFFLPVFELKITMPNIVESDYALIHMATSAMLSLGLLFNCDHSYAQGPTSAEPNPPMQVSKKQKRTSRAIVEEHGDQLRLAMIALYQLNPHELQKSASVSPEEMTQWVFEGPFGWKFDALREAQGIEALNLAFDPEFHGDRILAMITGIQTMIIAAYGGKTEFLFPDPVNPQRLNVAAHNLNTILSKLKNADSGNLIGSRPSGIVMDENILSTLTSIQQDLELDAKQYAINHQETVAMDAASFGTADFLPF